jgi:putative flippase GtrA
MTETKFAYLINFVACVLLLAFWAVILWIDDNPSRVASIGVSLIIGWYMHKIITRINPSARK